MSTDPYREPGNVTLVMSTCGAPLARFIGFIACVETMGFGAGYGSRLLLGSDERQDQVNSINILRFAENKGDIRQELERRMPER